MQIPQNPLASTHGPTNMAQPSGETLTAIGSSASRGSPELKQAFEDFVGQTFFGEMVKAFRSTQQPSAYFHGGRAEEIFEGQFDQALTEELSQASASKIAEPMYELFMLKRQS